MRDFCPVCNTKLIKSKVGDGLLAYACGNCKVKGVGHDANEAWSDFCSNLGVVDPEGTTVLATPDTVNRDGFLQYVNNNIRAFANRAFANMSKSAVERLLTANANYITCEKSLEPLWSTEEGRQSLLDCFNEALSMAAELPALGYIIAFGGTAMFIPRVEAYSNILTNGVNAPFKWVSIEAVHERDKVKCTKVNGEFSLTFENIDMFNRGDVVSVAVYGYSNKHGKVIGDVYEARRLLEKGTASSSAYKQYKTMLDKWVKAESEGRVFSDNKGEYFNDVRYKKDGSTYEKKVYKAEIVNPYDGPHKEEMLKKVAGKSYLGPFLKERLGHNVVEEMNAITDVDVVEEQTPAEKSVDLAKMQVVEEQVVETADANEGESDV